MRWRKTIAVKQRPPKRPHLRMNLVLHECVRASHRQLCSPHSSSPVPEGAGCFLAYYDSTLKALGQGRSEAWDQTHYDRQVQRLREEVNSKDENEEPGHLDGYQLPSTAFSMLAPAATTSKLKWPLPGAAENACTMTGSESRRFTNARCRNRPLALACPPFSNIPGYGSLWGGTRLGSKI